MKVLFSDKKQRSHKLNKVDTYMGMISCAQIGESLPLS